MSTEEGHIRTELYHKVVHLKRQPRYSIKYDFILLLTAHLIFLPLRAPDDKLISGLGEKLLKMLTDNPILTCRLEDPSMSRMSAMGMVQKARLRQ